MRSRDLGFPSSPARLFAAHDKPTDTAGEPAGRHAEADSPQLHRDPRLRPGAHGPVFHARSLLSERLPRGLGECCRSFETNHGARWGRATGGRAPQTGSDHLHSYVPPALPVGAAHCVFHQLPAPELFLRIHAI